MTEILSSAQMRAVEGAAIESKSVTGQTLMERAGKAVLDAVFDQWPQLRHQPGRAVVLCGPGNNGGDGFVIARLLHRRGWKVALYLFGQRDRLPPDAACNAVLWEELGQITAPEHCPALRDLQPDLLVDALFGTGLVRGLGGKLAELAQAQAACPELVARSVAVDIPSGLCADSGRPLGACFRASLSVSFHRLKPGHVLDQGPEHCGRVVVGDIGLDAPCPEAARLVTAPAPAIAKAQGHKFSHGHAVVVSGGVGKGGAARLAARGALRVGAGLVTLACPPAALQENAARMDAVMLTRLADAAGLRALMADRRITALCMGPGLGLGAREVGLLDSALRAGRAGAALVLDADALTLLARDDALSGLLHARCILTPHAGEFARLFPDLAERLNTPPAQGPAFSRLDAARAGAKRTGALVLLKGADTVIAAPDGRTAIHAAHNDRTAPWLATAGAGDVLAGLITGLAARGLPLFDAACSAVWLHVESARAFGPGLIAEDLPEILPQVLRQQPE
ncbi:MAG: NAD(P)H-hydrate dehydratase [Rhodobacteraceae bacterium]|nr:NAD(P)H-hydrate dehydratase [Paracoccaceae bacterium]